MARLSAPSFADSLKKLVEAATAANFLAELICIFRNVARAPVVHKSTWKPLKRLAQGPRFYEDVGHNYGGSPGGDVEFAVSGAEGQRHMDIPSLSGMCDTLISPPRPVAPGGRFCDYTRKLRDYGRDTRHPLATLRN